MTGRMTSTEGAMEDGRRFTVDGEPVDLEALIDANRDGLDEDAIAALRAMRPGDAIAFGGGAWAEWIVACAASPEAPC